MCDAPRLHSLGRKRPVAASTALLHSCPNTCRDTGELALASKDMLGGKLQKGETAMVTKMLKDVGTITKVRMRNPAPDGWLCASLKIAKAGAHTPG